MSMNNNCIPKEGYDSAKVLILLRLMHLLLCTYQENISKTQKERLLLDDNITHYR